MKSLHFVPAARKKAAMETVKRMMNEIAGQAGFMFRNVNETEEPSLKVDRIDDFSDLCDPEGMGMERSELADYVNMKVAKETDMIKFWLENRGILPKLFQVAHRILAIPATSAASERVFSTAGRILEKRRTSLSAGSVNSLLFLHSNMK